MRNSSTEGVFRALYLMQEINAEDDAFSALIASRVKGVSGDRVTLNLELDTGHNVSIRSMRDHFLLSGLSDYWDGEDESTKMSIDRIVFYISKLLGLQDQEAYEVR